MLRLEEEVDLLRYAAFIWLYVIIPPVDKYRLVAERNALGPSMGLRDSRGRHIRQKTEGVYLRKKEIV
jgi:hypothetical protein